MTTDRLEDLLRSTLRAEAKAAEDRIADLEERVLLEIEERRPRLLWHEWLRQLLAPTASSRFGQLVVVGATAAIFLFVGIGISSNLLRHDDAAPKLSLQPVRFADGTQEVLFVLPALNAENVAVVGNFNSWEETALSDQDGDGIWTASIPLPPGRYEYAFLIDGRWWGQDPQADDWVQSFGQFSSVRYIGRGGEDV